jgi:hypothetical protein
VSRALRWVLFLSGPTLAFALALRAVDNFDLGFQLRIGELVLQSGIPTADPFSFPGEGMPWALEQWLGPAALFLAFRTLGIAGVIVFKALIAAAAIGLAAWASLQVSQSPIASALAALLAAAAAQVRFNAQANIFSLLGLAAVIFACAQVDASKRSRSALWLLALFGLWPHVHPGYLTGFAALSVFSFATLVHSLLPPRWSWTSRFTPPLVPREALLLCALCLGCAGAVVLSLRLFHPMGLAPLVRVLSIFSSATSRANITEYAPLWRSPMLSAPILVLWIFPIVAFAALRRSIPPALGAVALVLMVQALQVGRLVAEASLAAAPVFACAAVLLVSHLGERGAIDRLRLLFSPARTAVVLWLLVAATAAAHFATPEGSTLGWFDSYYPRACYEWIDANHLPPRGFNDLGFGGSFIFHFAGRRKTFIDGRSFYSDAFFNDDYTPIKQARPGFQAIAKKWGIDWYLLYPNRFRGLHEVLQRDPDFVLAHLEDHCAVYVRRAALPAGDR